METFICVYISLLVPVFFFLCVNPNATLEFFLHYRFMQDCKFRATLILFFSCVLRIMGWLCEKWASRIHGFKLGPFGMPTTGFSFTCIYSSIIHVQQQKLLFSLFTKITQEPVYRLGLHLPLLCMLQCRSQCRWEHGRPPKQRPYQPSLQGAKMDQPGVEANSWQGHLLPLVLH